MKEYGIKDGSMRGWRMGGRGRNKTSACRHPELMKDEEETKTTSKKIIDKILGRG